MELENLKKWHWMLIGLIIGLLVGYARNAIGPDVDGGITRETLTQVDFEANLLQLFDDNKPVVRDLLVHPPIDGTVWVTGLKAKYVRVRKNSSDLNSPIVRKAVADAFRYPASTPYEPKFYTNNLKLDSHSTVRDYLNQLGAASKDIPVAYRYAWWDEPRASIGIGALGGLLIVGGIWPLIVRLIVGAGFGRPAKTDKGYDLDRFKGESKVTKILIPDTRAEDAEKLASLNTAMEEKLAGFAISQDAEDEETRAENAAAESRIAALKTSPLESVATGHEDEVKEFRGEFYPVAKPTAHKDEIKP